MAEEKFPERSVAVVGPKARQAPGPGAVGRSFLLDGHGG